MSIVDSDEPFESHLDDVRLTERQDDPTGASIDERNRMITFDSDSLTIMVGVHRNKNGTLRLDGWLTPAGSHPVELRTETGPMTTNSDADGRFAIDQIPRGSVQLIVRPASLNHTISTPTIALHSADGT